MLICCKKKIQFIINEENCCAADIFVDSLSLLINLMHTYCKRIILFFTKTPNLWAVVFILVFLSGGEAGTHAVPVEAWSAQAEGEGVRDAALERGSGH